MEFLQIKIFSELSKNGSVLQTADKMKLSASSVRSHIRQMEEEWGYLLFDRENGQWQLNANGRIVQKYTDNILQLTNQLPHRIHDMGNLNETVSCDVRATFYLVRPLIREFSRKFPQIRVKTRGMPQDVRSDEMLTDLRFCLTDRDVLEENSVTLLQTEFYLAVSEDHPLAERSQINLQDVQNESFLMPPYGSEAREIYDRCFIRAGFIPHISMEVEGAFIVPRMIAANLGLALRIPSFFTSEKDEHVIYVPIRRPRCFVYFRLKWNRPEYLSAAALQFRDFVLEYFHVSSPEKKE